MKNLNDIISIIANIPNYSHKLILKELKENNLERIVSSHSNILILLYQNEEGVQ